VVVDTNVVAYFLLGTPKFVTEAREFWKQADELEVKGQAAETVRKGPCGRVNAAGGEARVKQRRLAASHVRLATSVRNPAWIKPLKATRARVKLR
jgi:predicted nucleic acid-binding protein